MSLRGFSRACLPTEQPRLGRRGQLGRAWQLGTAAVTLAFKLHHGAGFDGRLCLVGCWRRLQLVGRLGSCRAICVVQSIRRLELPW